MDKIKSDLTYIFDERDRIMREEGIDLTIDEVKEMNEINALREIVLDVQSPSSVYMTST